MKIYFMHDTLTPDNVRDTWDDAPHVPRIDDKIDFPTAGYMGQPVTWIVRDVHWNGSTDGQSATLTMGDPTEKDTHR